MSRTLLAIAGLATAMSAQPQRLAFEVASIKPDKSAGGKSSVRMTPGQIYMENVSLRKCIARAYNVSEDQDYTILGPDWLRFEVFDIIAKFPPETPPEQVRMMLQDLLADRFKLKLHHAVKEVPVYALVVGKNGAKLQESAPGTPGGFSMGPGHLMGRARTHCGACRSTLKRFLSTGPPSSGSYGPQGSLRIHAGLGAGWRPRGGR
jgi:uncharacterized protein (TIGR03435 family)